MSGAMLPPGMRPKIREVKEGDTPRFLEMNVRTADNGYVVSMLLNGAGKQMVFYTWEEMISFLKGAVNES